MMAHGRSLELRDIRPHPRPGAWKPNGWRQHSKAEARKAGVNRRRWLRADARAKRAARR